jgi:hypothetical protein
MAFAIAQQVSALSPFLLKSDDTVIDSHERGDRDFVEGENYKKRRVNAMEQYLRRNCRRIKSGKPK